MRTIYTITIVLIIALSGCMKTPVPIPLYPNGIPNSKPAPAGYAQRIYKSGIVDKVTVPTITPYLPWKWAANGTAVIICPGGGYARLPSQKSEATIAEEFSKIGVAAFVLKYRLPNDTIMVDKTIGPLQDVQRAIQMVREYATDWGVNPRKLGIVGFSAGGHLASTAATHFSKAFIDNTAGTNLRPDFTILIYPVISMGPLSHKISKEMLLGKNPSPDMVDLFSNDKQVTDKTPPTFLVHATNDNVVPVQNSILFYEALIKHKVKAEMHLYQAGGHSFELNNMTTKDIWFERLENWMNANGWL